MNYGQGNGRTWRDKINDQLSILEKKGVSILGVQDAIDYASKTSESIMGHDYGSGGKTDALRHLLLSAELHRTHPMIAPLLLYGHELGTNVIQGQSREDREMDLFNNELGKTIASSAKSRGDVERLAVEMLPRAKVLLRQAFPMTEEEAMREGFKEEAMQTGMAQPIKPMVRK